MYETVKVRGTRFPAGHYLCPNHPAQPGGPLIRIPGQPPQSFIGWKRVHVDKPHPVNELGDVVRKLDVVRDGATLQHAYKPVMYRWELDSTPVVVRLTREIRLAIERGDLEVVKDKKSGGDK